jgi:hypothetical protein
MTAMNVAPVNAAYTDYASRMKINGDWEDPYGQLRGISTEGTGTVSDPFIVEWYRFIGDLGGLWLINISYYVVIRNCIFQPSSSSGGMWIDRTDFIDIYDNQFYGQVDLTSVDNSTFHDNTIVGTRVSTSSSKHTRFFNNTFTGEGSEFSMTAVQNIYFGLNYMYESSTSIRFHGVLYSLIENNTIVNCTTGAQVSDADYNVVRYNVVNHTFYYGILLEEGCVGNSFYGNVIEDVGRDLPAHALAGPSYSGLHLVGSSAGNNISWNSFVGNERSAVDDSGNNYYANYWSDYEGLDDNDDGFGDSPYMVDGSSSSQDPIPRMGREIISYVVPQTTDTTTPTSVRTDFPIMDIGIIVAAVLIVVITAALVGKRLMTKNE